MSTQFEKYQNAIVDFLELYATYKPVNAPDSENQVIADLQRGHFQLVRIGWKGDGFSHRTIFHFDTKPDGKVWIQVNNTELDVAVELMERGVEKSDIVIGFQPPSHRQYTGYAVA